MEFAPPPKSFKEILNNDTPISFEEDKTPPPNKKVVVIDNRNQIEVLVGKEVDEHDETISNPEKVGKDCTKDDIKAIKKDFTDAIYISGAFNEDEAKTYLKTMYSNINNIDEISNNIEYFFSPKELAITYFRKNKKIEGIIGSNKLKEKTENFQKLYNNLEKRKIAKEFTANLKDNPYILTPDMIIKSEDKMA